MTINRETKGDTLFEIEFTHKGKKEIEYIYVWAKSALEASNYLILNHIWGKQHAIRVHSSNLLRWKEEANQKRYAE